MTYRCPEDPNDRTGQGVEQNNSRLVDDNGNRIPPAIRPAQDSDPSCDYTINAPARQLCDRLALLESKVPLMDEAAKVNNGDLALNGNFTAGGPIVDTIKPDFFEPSPDGTTPAMTEIPDVPNFNEPVVLAYEGAEYVANNQNFYREDETSAFAMIDGAQLVWLEMKDGKYILPTSNIVLSYTRNAIISATTKIAAPKIEADEIAAKTKGGAIAIESNIVAGWHITAGKDITAERYVTAAEGIISHLSIAADRDISAGNDIVAEGNITASAVKADTISAKTSGGAINVESDIRAERNHVVAQSVHAQGIYYHDESGLGAEIIDSRGNVTARSVTAIGAMNARRFIEMGAMKGCALCKAYQRESQSGAGDWRWNSSVMGGYGVHSLDDEDWFQVDSGITPFYILAFFF